MSKIIKLEGTEVYIGMDDQKIVKAPISAVNYPNPQVGDEIRIFKDGDTTIIARAAAAAPTVPQPQPQSLAFGGKNSSGGKSILRNSSQGIFSLARLVSIAL